MSGKPESDGLRGAPDTAPYSPATSGPRPGAPTGDAIPKQVGGYRLLRRLGGGGMGEVYEAEDRGTGQRVAMKLLAPQGEATAEDVERFRREGRLASSLTHPRCVFVLAADEDAGRPYIVMERMPGETLQDLVQRRGPLPVGEAVRLILDVLDGLQAAHRLQILHRDVKPSNCLLEADGRVKVGDFGLAKSLTADAALTQAGTFLGTIHYAAPEQFKGPAAVDVRSDLYGAAATLYFLLTGQPPFPEANAATVVARKASEAAPPLRPRRPEVPPGLERALLRGLERDPQRRWQDLGEFRAALLPFLPGHLSAAGVGMRVGALLIDYTLLSLLAALIQAFLVPPAWADLHEWLGVLLVLGLALVSFTVLEGLWGWSPGKRLLRLRVTTPGGSEPPGLGRAALRTLLFVAVWLPWLVGRPGSQLSWFDPALWAGTLLLGALLPAASMRRRNGYRGLHELLSGTRVVELPWPERRPSFSCPAGPPEPAAGYAGRLPEQVGPFRVRGALAAGADEVLLLGQEDGLKRDAWVRLRPAAEAPTDAARREVRRPTRLRWLGGGQLEDRRWDAYLAPAGCPLTDVIAAQGPLPWVEVRPLLEQLAEELAAARQDGTLPARLDLAQVWLQADGRAQLLDAAPAGARSTTAGTGDGPLTLLRQVALLALEGRLPPPGEAPAAVRAPLPLHASRLLAGLLGGDQPYKDVEEFRADLVATRQLPAEVTPSRRAAHLAVLGALVFPGLLCMFLAALGLTLVMAVGVENEMMEADTWLRLLDDESVREDLLADLPHSAELARQRLSRIRELDERTLKAAFPLLRYTFGIVGGMSGEPSSWLLDRQQIQVSLQQARPFRAVITRRGRLGQVVRTDEFTESHLQLLVGSDQLLTTEVRPLVLLFGAPLHLVMVCAGPVVWLVWSFLFRGGWSLRLMGLALVRADGRRAARWQCAWRTLLVWAPVTALLLAAAWYDYRVWSVGKGEQPAWGYGLPAVGLWWAALLLLMGYFLYAFRHPGRGLHDRLAGTYLVPR